MRIGIRNQKEPQEKSSGSLKGQQKKEEKRGNCINLIYFICFSIVGFVGLNFISCNFMLPNSLNSANAEGKLKNPPPLDCKESERRGYEILLSVLTTVIALRTKMDDN